MLKENTKNIAIITNSSAWIISKNKQYGGSNTVAYNVFSVLKKLDYHITILCPNSGDEYSENQLTVKYLNYPIGSNEFTEALLTEMPKYDKIINFSTENITDGVILQSHTYSYRATLPIKLYTPLKRFLYRKRINIQKKRYNKELNYAFAVSQGIKEDYEKNLGLKNIIVAYPGCEQIYNEFYESKNNILTFGFIYNNSVNKSGFFCLLGLGISKLLGLKFNLKIILQKQEKNSFLNVLLNLFDLKEVTTVLSRQSDMSNFYESIDCVIMPSIHEAFGLVPLEALAFCKTCLVSQNIGFTEIIDKDTCFTFNRSSFISFLIGLFKVHKMFYKNRTKFDEICKNGWEISKEYTWEKFVEELLE